MFDRSQIHQGEKVCDVNGNDVGSVRGIHNDHVDISTGFLGLEHLHVPFSEISGIGNDMVFLNVSKEQIGNKGWQNEPAQTTGTMQSTGTAQSMGTTQPIETIRPTGTTSGNMYGTYPAAAPTAGAPQRQQVQFPDDISKFAVYSSDDKEVGQIAERQANYVRVSTGFLGLGGNIYIPTDCFDRCDASNQRCYLTLSKDQIDAYNWNNPPSEGENRSCQSGTATQSGQFTGQTGSTEGWGTEGQTTSGETHIPIKEIPSNPSDETNFGR